ncbi:MAG TPA: integrase [Ktedonobacteraceae bacterium]
MGKRPGLKYAAVKRLDGLMAPGKKRSEAKAEARLRGESLFAFTDGKIHAFESRTNYQKIVMWFLDWCRNEHDLHDLTQIDGQADELASYYLSERILKGYSAWTLQTERSALRTFFQNRNLAAEVARPKRRRENIVRSRRPAKRDANFQPDRWQPLIKFCLACGLRREELRDLRVRDIYDRENGELVVHVRKGKGGKERVVTVFPGREQDVLAVVAGRAHLEHVFVRLSSALDIHSYRRHFAQDLYELLSGRPLPPVEGRLHAADFDREAALQVSRQLGHNRVEVIFSNYIR